MPFRNSVMSDEALLTADRAYPREWFKNRYYTTGQVGACTFFLVFALALFRTIVHIRMKSKLERIAFHVATSFAAALEFVYFLSFIVISNSDVYNPHLFKNFRVLHNFAVSLHLLCVLSICQSWFKLRSTIREKEGRIRNIRPTSRCSDISLLFSVFTIQFTLSCVFSFQVYSVKSYSELRNVLQGSLNVAFFTCNVVLIMLLAGMMLYSGILLQKRMKVATYLSVYELRKGIIQINFALGIILGCAILRIVVFLILTVKEFFVLKNGFYLGHVLLDTILPTSATLLAGLYLFRRKLARTNASENLLEEM